MPQEFTTGVGRIVWGNPAKPVIKKHQDGPDKGKPVLKDGQPVLQWAFGVAFPKADFQAGIYPYMHAEMSTGFPNGPPAKFAWKFIDGDTVDGNGQPYANREGYAGCYVLAISTEAFAPPIYKFANGGYAQHPADQIKTGDYVSLGLLVKLNVPTDRTRVPSLYVNPRAVEHVGYGKEIQNGPDAQAIFGGRQHALPPGASATPVASSGGLGMPQPAAMQAMPGMMPQPAVVQAMPGMMPQPAVVPAHDFVQNAGMQQPAAPAMPGMPGMVPMPGNR